MEGKKENPYKEGEGMGKKEGVKELKGREKRREGKGRRGKGRWKEGKKERKRKKEN